MQIVFQHRFAAPRSQLETLLVSRESVKRLHGALPMVRSMELVGFLDDGQTATRTARVVPAKAPLAGIPASWFAWTERVTWDRRDHAGRFAVRVSGAPRYVRDRLRIEGTYALSAESRGTLRTVTLNVQAGLPMAVFVERVVGEFLGRYFEAEAERLAAWSAPR